MQVGALKETIHRYVDKMEQLVQVKAEELCQGQDGSKQTVDLYEFIVPLMVSLFRVVIPHRSSLTSSMKPHPQPSFPPCFPPQRPWSISGHSINSSPSSTSSSSLRLHVSQHEKPCTR